MGHKKRRLSLFAVILSGLCLAMALFVLGSPTLVVRGQQPTVSIPTVTGTPIGPQVKVYSERKIIGVYAGPSSYLYAQIGILLAGETAPAIGLSLDGQWIQIIYKGVPGGKGWVYAPYVSLMQGGSLPHVPDPPTATPRTTPTLNPTLVATYGLNLEPTRAPTFTAPPPVQIPTFASPGRSTWSVPAGFIIIGLVLVGVLGAVLSLLRGR